MQLIIKNSFDTAQEVGGFFPSQQLYNAKCSEGI